MEAWQGKIQCSQPPASQKGMMRAAPLSPHPHSEGPRGQGPLPPLSLSLVTTRAIEAPGRSQVINSGDSQTEGV